MSDAPVQDFLDNTFSYHKPFGDQPSRYEKIRASARALAVVILGNTPAGSREQGIAIDALRSCVMFANAAIACNEVEPAPLAADTAAPEPSIAAEPVPSPAPQPSVAAPADSVPGVPFVEPEALRAAAAENPTEPAPAPAADAPAPDQGQGQAPEAQAVPAAQ